MIFNNYNINTLPPILAFVDVGSREKHQLFQKGVLDYISYPIIEDELKYRVQQALFYDELLQTPESPQDSPQILSISQPPAVKAEILLAEKISEYLISHLDKDVKLVDLTRAMGTNKNKLSKAFKTHFGMTMFNYLREQRMLLAAELLKNTSQGIVQIALQVGFIDPNYFSYAFKCAFNMSPRRYRNVFI